MYAEIRRICPFEEAGDFIHISKMPSHNITIGIALPYIRKFLDDIDATFDSLIWRNDTSFVTPFVNSK